MNLSVYYSGGMSPDNDMKNCFLSYYCFGKNASSLDVPVFLRTCAQTLGSTALNSSPIDSSSVCTSLPSDGAAKIARTGRFTFAFIGLMYFASCKAASFVAVLRFTSTIKSLPS